MKPFILQILIHTLLVSTFYYGVISSGFAQLAFSRKDAVPVVVSGKQLRNPWAGGINSAQVSQIDLNQDGLKDLFIFDRDGNTIKPFVNKGNSDSADYEFAPQYINSFPSLMRNIALLADYNCDGKEDIFTWVPGGLKVYRNISTTQTGLNFTLVSQMLYSEYTPNMVNLYVSSTDIPAITDIDGDGDLDILSFGVVGTSVEYHKNLSKENYGHCDSLVFKMVDGCWGKFFENASNNSVNFPVSCRKSLPDTMQVESGAKHSGSTIFALDMNGDGDKEVALGDVSFNNMVLLTNGGTTSSASIVAQDTAFPSNTLPVNLAFPAGFFVDVNNDGLKDLVACTNISNASDNVSSVWWYKNTASNNAPVFVHKKKDLLQDDMIDIGAGANPVFFDYNADGLKDLVIGNYGYYDNNGNYIGKLALYKNKGTVGSPSFELVSNDYLGLSSLLLTGLYPTFGDMDADGDKDLLLGDSQGRVHLFENTAGPGNTASFVLKNTIYKQIDVGFFATPHIADVNRDGKPDLLIGEQAGNINYFQNTGTTVSPDFSSTPTNSLFGGIDVMIPCCAGYSAPFLIEKETTLEYVLYVGSESGIIYYYTGIDNNLGGNFTLSDSIKTNAFRVSVCLADINGNGTNELVYGEYAGGAVILSKDASLPIADYRLPIAGLRIFPQPAKDHIIISGEGITNTPLEIIITNLAGQQMNRKKVKSVGDTIHLDIAFLPPGCYLFNIRSETTYWLSKIIIMP